MTKEKDDRWAKQFGDFAENLTMYILGQIKNMSVALIDHEGKSTHWLSDIRSCEKIAYFEMQFNVLEEIVVFED